MPAIELTRDELLLLIELADLGADVLVEQLSDRVYPEEDEAYVAERLESWLALYRRISPW